MKENDIIIRPILSEKSYAGIQSKTYTFEVAIKSNKVEIRKAIETLFGVQVEKVNTLIVKGKKKTRNTKAGRTVGKTKTIKKAVVILKPASKAIAFFESLA